MKPAILVAGVTRRLLAAPLAGGYVPMRRVTV
jgi:hypothetical protein